MRLHRDVDPDSSEPDEGWVGPGEESSTPLSDVLGLWTVVRHWRRVEARSASDAIARTAEEPPDDGRASHELMTMLYLTKPELTVLLTSIAASLGQMETNLKLASFEQTQSVLRYQWQVLSSLRTAVAEARYDLMSPEEIDAEKAALQEARDAGIIT